MEARLLEWKPPFQQPSFYPNREYPTAVVAEQEKAAGQGREAMGLGEGVERQAVEAGGSAFFLDNPMSCLGEKKEPTNRFMVRQFTKFVVCGSSRLKKYFYSVWGLQAASGHIWASQAIDRECELTSSKPQNMFLPILLIIFSVQCTA